MEEALPTLSVFAFAGYKLVPAFHQVFTGFSVAGFYLEALKELEEDLDAGYVDTPGPRGALEPLHLRRALNLQKIVFRYDPQLDPALAVDELTIRRGERIGVVGPSGAGKTTLVDVLLGLLHCQEGRIAVDEVPLEGDTWLRWRAAVGYVPQAIFLADDTVAANIAFGTPQEEIDHDAVQRAAMMAGLHDFVREMPDGYGTLVGERGVRLSGGQRQRIGLARALYRNPSLLLLDEATSALDLATERQVMDALYGLERERTLIVVAHRLSTVRRCDRIVLLEHGRVAAVGPWEKLLEESELFRVLTRLDVSGGL